MFYYNELLNGQDLSKWNTSSVTNFTNMFYYTSRIATSSVWYYGTNSTNLYDNRTTANANYITLEYKSN